MSDELRPLSGFADEPGHGSPSPLDPSVTEPMEPGMGMGDDLTPPPGHGSPSPLDPSVTEPMEPGIGDVPLPGHGPGDFGELAPGTVFPGIAPASGGTGSGGTVGGVAPSMVVSPHYLWDFLVPPKPAPRIILCSNDWVTFTAGTSPLTVTVYNGYINDQALVVMAGTTVGQGRSVTYTGCFTHWYGDSQTGGYTAVGRYDGEEFSFQ